MSTEPEEKNVLEPGQNEGSEGEEANWQALSSWLMILLMQQSATQAQGLPSNSLKDQIGSKIPGWFTPKIALLLVLFSSWVLKVYLVFAAQNMRLFGDQGMYLRMSRAFARGEGFTVDEANLWPPGLVTFVGTHIKIFGNDLFYPRMTQTLLATATVYFIYRIAWHVLGKQWLAITTALVVGFYPSLVAFSHYIWAETLYIFCLTGAVATYFEAIKSDKRMWFVLSAILWALSAYAKSIGLYLIVPWVAWHLWQCAPGARRRAAAHIAVFMTVAACCILPWTYRNYQEFDRFVLIGISMGRNLYYGHNNLGPPNWDYKMRRPFGRKAKGNRPRCDDLPGMTHPKDVEKCEVEGAIQFIKDNPVETLRRFPVKMADLFNPTSPVVNGIATGRYRPPAEGNYRLFLMAINIVPYLILGIGVVLALTLTPYDKWRWWFVGFLLYHMAVHWATVGMSRYRIPMEPFLAILAVQGWYYGPKRLLSLRGWGLQPVLFYTLMAVVVWMWSTRTQSGIDEILAGVF